MPLKIKATFSEVHLNEEKYLRDTSRVIGKVIKEAAREFLIAVLDAVEGAPHTSGDNFPIQTGEAKGSLLPLGSKLGQFSVPISITPAVKTTSKTGRATYQPDRSSIGRSKGKAILTPITSGTLDYEFSFSTDVLHFAINDLTHSRIPKSSTPWNTMKIGFAAFEEYIDAHLFNRMPRLDDYLFTSEVST